MAHVSIVPYSLLTPNQANQQVSSLAQQVFNYDNLPVRWTSTVYGNLIGPLAT